MDKIIMIIFLFFVQITIFFKSSGLKNKYLQKYYLSLVVYILGYPIINRICFYYLKKNIIFNFIFINDRYYIFFQLIVFVIILFIAKDKISSIFLKRNNLFYVLKGIELFIIILIFNYVLFNLFKLYTNDNFLIKRILVNENNLYFKIIFIVILGIFASIAEEIVFRYFLIEGLVKKNNKIAVVLYSSITFAVVHFQLDTVIIYIFYSVLYSIYYLKYRSIYITLTCHIISNLTVLYTFI